LPVATNEGNPSPWRPEVFAQLNAFVTTLEEPELRLAFNVLALCQVALVQAFSPASKTRPAA
jgi:hypothetical protein